FSAALLKGAGHPAMDGWYATIAAPYIAGNPEVASWIKTFNEKYRIMPSGYSFTAYEAMLVAFDALKRLATEVKPLNRDTRRDAIHTANVKPLQGTVSFDENGDIKDGTVSVFDYEYSENYAVDDVIHQYKYLGVAPSTSLV